MKKTRNVIPCLSAWKLWEAHAAQLLPGLSDERPPAGVDEAGRGCLAGPVVAAAVILPESAELPGLTDSKALSAAQRAALAPRIRQCATAWGLGVVWPRRIDEINILQATFEAMTRAVCLLSVTPGMIYVDGNKTIPDQTLRARWTAARFPQQEAVVGGDARVDAIAAASVLAKTFRDHVMECLARRWPGYGFEQHKGYGTQAHYAALRRLGPCPQHRLTYKGVAAPESVTCRQGDLL
ncbi:ribonuclease HII [uncultured Desulfovibrio sp.]|uniref:ribonuclease HII n=1 Tax=uncultured Desulfovibrio sp. TaxID=167968 RepID=UPI00261FAB6E|nr:ribonuclease HII [uncultured Desulfovibrio sp.]